MRRWVTVAVLIALVVGCSSADPVSITAQEVAPPSSPIVTATTRAVTVSTVTPTTAVTPEPVTSTTSAPAPAKPYLAGLGLEPITLHSPGSGARPLLSWESVETATDYTVLVLDANGEPWWAWSGVGTEVVLGGVDTAAEIGGPTARPGVRWVVFAHDANGQLVGSSPLTSVTD